MDIDHAKSELQQMAGVKKNSNPVKISEKKGFATPYVQIHEVEIDCKKQRIS
jgi:hypothetical protein